LTQIDVINALEILGHKLALIKTGDPVMEKSEIENKWFTPASQLKAFNYWSEHLTNKNLTEWLTEYSFTENPKKVGLVMAGNIPLVGLHDLICILASGHIAMVKPSSDDKVLITLIIEELFKIDHRLKAKIEIVNRLNSAEALIATGSNNTARYFEYYFQNVPRIIRKNRNSIAVLQGNETPEELSALAKDIFTYFGLGCRNVSKLLVPEQYNFNQFFEGIESYHTYSNHNKYYNNYTYHKAIFLMNIAPHLDNGFLILKEDDRLHSPLGTLYFSYYKERNDIIEYIDQHKDDIQIVVGHSGYIADCIPFGKSQNPDLSDYADDKDTLQFLNQL